MELKWVREHGLEDRSALACFLPLSFIAPFLFSGVCHGHRLAHRLLAVYSRKLRLRAICAIGHGTWGGTGRRRWTTPGPEGAERAEQARGHTLFQL